MKYSVDVQWNQTKEVIIGLYPKWNLTVEQATAFREAFQPLWQPALREAVRRLWLEDKFGSGTLNPGRLKAMYGRVRAESEAVQHAAAPSPDTEANPEEIRQSHENLLRRVLMAPVAAVAAASDLIRGGVGRWGWIRPQKSGGNDPTEWSAMMRSAVMYEIENPSAMEGVTDEMADDADPTEFGGDLPEAGGLDFSGPSGGDDREGPERNT